MQRVPPVVLKARGRHTATLIFLHGLGDTGHGWAAALNTIKPSYLKVVCPTAPTAPVTLNFGMPMPSWYDIFHLDDDPSRPREDLQGVRKSSDFLASLVEAETGPEVPRNRIMIGGFSQGGAVSLATLFRSADRSADDDSKSAGAAADLAGCIALSTYVPGNKRPDSKDSQSAESSSKVPTLTSSVPVLQCHGEMDEMISIGRGRLTNQIVQSLTSDVRFHTFPHMGHESSEEELEIVRKFILDVLGPE